jgi:hypothetical protein
MAEEHGHGHGHDHHDHDVEKGNYNSETTLAIHGVHGVHGHAGRRLRHFFRPDGRKVHIAATPEEVEKLKRKLSVSDPTLMGDKGFDVVIHGSLDHVSSFPFSCCEIEDWMVARRWYC